MVQIWCNVTLVCELKYISLRVWVRHSYLANVLMIETCERVLSLYLLKFFNFLILLGKFLSIWQTYYNSLEWCDWLLTMWVCTKSGSPFLVSPVQIYQNIWTPDNLFQFCWNFGTVWNKNFWYIWASLKYFTPLESAFHTLCKGI